MSTNLHLIIKPYGMARIMERKIGTVIVRTITEFMKSKENNLETILKKVKDGRASGEDNMLSEMYKYLQEKFKTGFFQNFNAICVTGTRPAEQNIAPFIPVYKIRDSKDPNNYGGIKFLNSCYIIYTKLLKKSVIQIGRSLVRSQPDLNLLVTNFMFCLHVK